MTLSRRAFTFASLAAAFGKVARAETPDADAQQAQGIPELNEAPAPTPFEVVPTLVQAGADLELRLKVTNRGQDAVPLLVARGARPAGDPAVLVEVGGEWTALAPVLGDVDRREMMSRMGPVPKFAELVAGKSVDLGPFRFALPKGAKPPATVQVNLVSGKLYESRPLEVTGVTWSARKA